MQMKKYMYFDIMNITFPIPAFCLNVSTAIEMHLKIYIEIMNFTFPIYTFCSNVFTINEIRKSFHVDFEICNYYFNKNCMFYFNIIRSCY